MDVTVRITRKRDNIKVTILYIIVKDFKTAYEKCDEFLTVLRPSNKDDIEITLTRNRM